MIIFSTHYTSISTGIKPAFNCQGDTRDDCSNLEHLLDFSGLLGFRDGESGDGISGKDGASLHVYLYLGCKPRIQNRMWPEHC